MGERGRQAWLLRAALAGCLWLAALAAVWAGPLWAADGEPCATTVRTDCPTLAPAVEPLSPEPPAPESAAPQTTPAEDRPCPVPVGEGVICRGPDVPLSPTVYLPLVRR
ncbi:MAG TPA: hypothetical protein VNK95_08540 [Caldilineaceae bacterium]|nr:hypothetical protein [Caldilineaceae bacterium]